MLRIAVISLLVANLLLLGFQDSKPATQPKIISKQTVFQNSGIPTIHLFSEMVEDQSLMSGNRHCFSLGPFHSVEDKNETRVLLEDVSANISERETQALVEKGYWVFMPPYESLLEANQVLFSLQALGLKDIAVIYNGDWENAISLGYFLRQENALRRKKDLEDRDFVPKIRVQRQSESRYWLDFEQKPGSGLIALDMQDRPNDFMQRSLPCPDQNPFEITAGVAGVSENPAVETEQSQAQLPKEEAQPAPEENIEPPPEEISESLPEEISEPQPEEISKSPTEEIIEPQTAEEDSLQPEAGDGAQPTEEINLDTEAEVPEPAIETKPENGLGAEQQNTDEAATDKTIATVPENDPGAALQNSNEVEPEVPENIAGDSLQQQVEVPGEGDSEEGDVLQAIEDDAINAAEIIDSTPVDSEKAVPGPVIETQPESSVETGPAIETESENSIGTESVIETEPEHSVGTGPVIGFGTEPEDSDENEAGNSDEAGVEDSFGTESEDSDGTATDDG